MKMRTRIAFLVVAAALTAGGLFTGIAQSQQPQAPDQSRQRAATKMVQDAYKAGKGRVHAVAKQYSAIWRNNQYHVVQYVQKIIIVETRYGPAEIQENGAPPQGMEAQLPAINPAIPERAPTAAEDAAIEARLKALNYEAHRATGMPPVPEKLRKAQGLPEG